ncbi:ABC transporter permease subunit [Jeotgalibacillus proteolyticus]|uniref:ABC transporter permease subunit n=1 Tax=Jeotgalibacillus proteolyticus TaxID=2082395 RepID=UPI003CEBD740
MIEKNYPMHIAKIVFSSLVKLIVIVISICSIASLPYLLTSSKVGEAAVGFFPVNYMQEIAAALIGLFSFYDREETTVRGVHIDIGYMLEAYQYSMSLLLMSLGIAFVVVLIFTCLYHLLTYRMKKLAKWILVFLDCIPDVILILIFQLSVILLYKETGFKLLQLYGIGNDVYLLPVICLSITPTVLLLKISLRIHDDEQSKEYIDFALSKGLSRQYVFLIHVLRNIFFSITNHVGLIYWMMLSGLIVIEYLFVIQGFTMILYRANDSSILAIAIMLFLIPYALLQWIFSQIDKRRVNDEN